MLQKIKTQYFIPVIFSFIDDGCKLRIVRYNKNIQKIIDVSLMDYKRYSDSYIIYETNKKGKEYDHKDLLVYEGEYLNGKRNGKGKE